jgi:hypothetical protein
MGVSDLKFRLACVGFLFATGCGDGGGGAAGDGASCGEEGITLTGVVNEFTLGKERQQFPPLERVKVCVHDDPSVPCVRTDDSGIFVLCNVPTNEDLILSFEKDGYVPSLRMIVTRTEDYDILAETVLGSIDDGLMEAEKFGVDLRGIRGGALQFFGARPGDGVLQVATLEGFSVELTDADGEPATCVAEDGKGEAPCQPIYLEPNGEPNLDLTESTRFGVGAIGNVNPGEYVLRFSHPDFVCERLPESGWAADEDSAIRVEVVENFITAQVGMFCQPPE